MKKAAWVLAGLLSAGIVGLPTFVQAAGTGHVHGIVAAEKDIDFKDAPKVVQDVVVKTTSGAKVHHVVQYDVHGRNHFHVIVGNGVVRHTLVLDDEGNILITKDTIEFDDLPGKVKEAFGREAGSGRMENNIEKVLNADKIYYIGNADEKDGNEKVIRVGEDGKLISENYEEDEQLAGEKAVPDSDRVIRTDIKSETVRFDDLPGQVKTTIGAKAKSDPIVSVLRLSPGDKYEDAYVAVVGKDTATQRKIFVDGKGDVLDGTELDPYIEAPAEHHHHG